MQLRNSAQLVLNFQNLPRLLRKTVYFGCYFGFADHLGFTAEQSEKNTFFLPTFSKYEFPIRTCPRIVDISARITYFSLPYIVSNSKTIIFGERIYSKNIISDVLCLFFQELNRILGERELRGPFKIHFQIVIPFVQKGVTTSYFLDRELQDQKYT